MGGHDLTALGSSSSSLGSVLTPWSLPGILSASLSKQIITFLKIKKKRIYGKTKISLTFQEKLYAKSYSLYYNYHYFLIVKALFV